MRRRRLELPWVAPLAPQASVSTNSTIAAFSVRNLRSVNDDNLSKGKKKVNTGFPKIEKPASAFSFFLLDGRLPQAVEITVFVGRNHFVVGGEGEGYDGLVAGLEGFALAAFFGFDVDPLDVVFGGHGVFD